MSKNKYFFLVLVLLLTACNPPEKTTTIEISTASENLNEAVLIRPIDGIILWDNKKDTILGTKGNFSKTVLLDKPEFVRLVIDQLWIPLLIEPGKSYKILTDGKEFKFEGENISGNKFFARLKRPTNYEYEYFFEKDSSLIDIRNKVNRFKNKEIKYLDSLFELEEVSESYYVNIRRDIDYDYANLYVSVLNAKSAKGVLKTHYVRSSIDSIFREYPINTKPLPLYWNTYVENYLIYTQKSEQLASGKITYDSLQKLWEEDKLHKRNIEIIKNGLQEDFREKAIANYLMKESSQQKFEKSLIGLFKDFQDDYPKSNYSKYILPEIQKIVIFYERAESPLSDNVRILEEEFNTLPELLEKFKGQKLYIDVWATWCGPCVREFESIPKSKKLLEQYNYKKLYISFDNAKQQKKWLETIKYFDLKGFHYLANNKFIKDFSDKYSLMKGGYSIPQYLLIDENGNIIAKNAPRPSQIERLEKTLKSD
ncbi:redoxin family protein [Aquimarina brevivitae]|uniref:Thiol-disulfide isomerase/thioredoxin n=1 Tax=Aquimarina brevivitae TaxID=323412 RepID=A0A4Q7PF88_9FLAO|nr:redoxin family protein [Aquimarina brevivitae]RZS99143.1 thiol-disulfide isomerase/thioredoxin [Aquimarina brevivitae]